MEQRLDYYTLIGFVPETDAPEDLEGLRIPADEVALLLDFDGTLVDIAETPDAIKVGGDDRSLLEDLGRRHAGAVAIVSGRNLSEINHYLEGFSGTISGGHGAELRHAGRDIEDFKCDFDRLSHIKNAVMEFAAMDTRLLAEDKSFGIVLHFRQHPELEGKCHAFLKSLVDDDEEFELQSAKKAFEVKPKAISKASAIERIIAFEEFYRRTVLFAGDDVTDEVAFAWINERGGITIKVGDGPTVARYRTRSPETLKSWLRSHVGSGKVEA